ncbi:MAG: hypothetical protein LIO44_05225 [Eubacterium sp.]|nr:hypothetical protein [Eubacterium sp.]
MGYTVYGEWYGNTYGKWDAMFISYCLDYAGISDDIFPKNSGAFAWYGELDGLGCYYERDGYEPIAGDIVFFDIDDDEKPDLVGAVTAVDKDENKITVVEGDFPCDDGYDRVCENGFYLDDETITGYGHIPDEEASAAVIYTAEDENSGVNVKVTAAKEALPEEAELYITLFDESRDEYTAAGEAIGFNSEEANLAVVDIAFSLGGEKTEPTEAVAVSLDISAILPEDADPSTVSITHLAETEEGIEPVLVADATEETEGTIDTEAAVAEFTVDSFSSFTITWASGNRRFTATTTSYLYSDGTTTTEITGISSLSASLNTALNFTSSNSDLDVDGYTLETASVTYTRNNQTTTISDVTAITVTSITTSGRNTVAAVTVTTSSGTTTLSSVSSMSISLYYSKDDGQEEEDEEEEENFDGLDASSYNEDAYVYWDTITTSTSNTVGYEGVGDGGSGIASVVLAELPITQADSNATSSTASSLWSASTYQLSDLYPDANASTQATDTATLIITPETGYYVSRVLIACANVTKTPPGFHGPYTCTTLLNSYAYNKAFQISGSGVLTVNLSSMYFSHDSDDDEYYFILIQLSPVADPLYVQYDYGEIVDILGVTSGYGGAFDSANGWTTASSGNSYGYENSKIIEDGDVGVKTSDTQFKYGYLDPEDAGEWEHYANTVTDAAKEEAAAAGYYFVGWKAEYYYSVDLAFSSGIDEYLYAENYIYTFNSSDLYYTTTYSEGDSVGLPTHAKLIAQWEPIELTLTKTVEGLTDTEFEDTEQTYSLTLQKYDEENDVWVDYDTAELTITGDGTLSKIFSPIGTGTYRVIEDTSGISTLTGTSTTLYLNVSTDGTLTITSDQITGGTTSFTYDVTNTYSAGRTEPLPSTGGATPLPYGLAFVIITGFVVFICKRSI